MVKGKEQERQANSRQFTIQKSKISVSQNSKMKRRNFVITKKIAKHGSQAIIVIPRILESELRPGTLAEIKINVLDEGEGK